MRQPSSLSTTSTTSNLFWDGGRLEYSTDGGSSWHDILLGDDETVGDNPGRFVSGPYSGFVSVGTGHPFGGERAWTGFDTGWTETVVESCRFRRLDRAVSLAARLRSGRRPRGLVG